MTTILVISSSAVFVHFKDNLSYKRILEELLKRDVFTNGELLKIKNSLSATNVKFPVLCPAQSSTLIKKIVYVSLSSRAKAYINKICYVPDKFFKNNKEVERVWDDFCLSIQGSAYKYKLEFIFNILLFLAVSKKA